MTPSNFALGIFLNLLGSVSINLGTNVVKLSHTKEESCNREQTCCSLWGIGVFTFVCGNILNFVSFSFAPQSLLAALGSVQFLSNVVFGVVLLGVKITLPTLAATGLIIAGNLVIVSHSSQTSQQLTIDDLINRYFDSSYPYYLCFLCFLVAVLQWVYFHANNRYKHANEDRFRIIPFSYAAVSAIVGSQSVLLAKSTSILVRATITAEEDQLSRPFSHAILGAWLLTMSFWLYRMNTALRRFDTLFIVPVLQVLWTLFSILGGGLYFQEFASFDAHTTTMFIFGVALVVSGVCVLASNNSHTVSNKGSDEAPIVSTELRRLKTCSSSCSISTVSEDGWQTQSSWQTPPSNVSFFSMWVPFETNLRPTPDFGV